MEDEFVVRVTKRGFRIRASDARALVKATGQTFTELTTGGDLANQVQTFAFLELRKRERADLEGKTATAEMYRDPAEMWEQAEDIDVEFEDDAPMPDPYGATSS